MESGDLNSSSKVVRFTTRHSYRQDDTNDMAHTLLHPFHDSPML